MKQNFSSLVVVAAIIFSAALTSCDKDDVTYTVNFNSNGGIPAPQEQTVKKGGKIVKPADPTRENYSLAGWAKANNETSALWNFETETVNEDMTLFARWSINMHLVTFDSDGGSAVSAQNIIHGNTVTKPATDPTRDGYEFDGWFNGETEWNFATAITAAITLKAKWTAVHVVTFDSDGGSEEPAQTIRNGNKATKPATDPTKDGFEFDGWFNGDTEWIFTTAITAPITLKAQWTAVHLVTFDSDGGSAVPAQTIRNGTTTTKPTDPTKTIVSGLYLGMPSENYTFDGWFHGDTEWNFATTITAPIILKAKWSLPGDVSRIETVLSNDVGGAFTYVNANSYSGEEYTLLIGADITPGAQTLNAANAKLTIKGIGGEKTISTTSSYYVGKFTIDGNNATSLTLGQNITLKWWDIDIRRGNLTMLDDSKITEISFSSVYVSGSNAIFKMEGGEIISGNSFSNASPAGIVSVDNGGTFEMSGGSVIGNTSNSRGVADIYIGYDCTFRLSGNARIGALMLNSYYDTARSSVTIGGNFNGTVTRLHLTSSNSSDVSNIRAWWTNVPVIINGTADVINMFNNGLGNFQATITTGTSIGETHELNSSGLLVLKEY